MTTERFFLILLVYLKNKTVVLPCGFKENDEEYDMV